MRCGDGWRPVGALPCALTPQIAELQRLAAAAGYAPPVVVQMKTLLLGDPPAAVEMANAYAAAGVIYLVRTRGARDEHEFGQVVNVLCGMIPLNLI